MNIKLHIEGGNFDDFYYNLTNLLHRFQEKENPRSRPEAYEDPPIALEDLKAPSVKLDGSALEDSIELKEAYDKAKPHERALGFEQRLRLLEKGITHDGIEDRVAGLEKDARKVGSRLERLEFNQSKAVVTVPLSDRISDLEHAAENPPPPHPYGSVREMAQSLSNLWARHGKLEDKREVSRDRFASLVGEVLELNNEVFGAEEGKMSIGDFVKDVVGRLMQLEQNEEQRDKQVEKLTELVQHLPELRASHSRVLSDLAKLEHKVTSRLAKLNNRMNDYEAKQDEEEEENIAAQNRAAGERSTIATEIIELKKRLAELESRQDPTRYYPDVAQDPSAQKGGGMAWPAGNVPHPDS